MGLFSAFFAYLADSKQVKPLGFVYERTGYVL